MKTQTESVNAMNRTKPILILYTGVRKKWGPVKGDLLSRSPKQALLLSIFLRVIAGIGSKS